MSAISSMSELLLSATTAGDMSAAAVAPLDEVLTDHRLLERLRKVTRETSPSLSGVIAPDYELVYRMTND